MHTAHMNSQWIFNLQTGSNQAIIKTKLLYFRLQHLRQMQSLQFIKAYTYSEPQEVSSTKGKLNT